MKSRKTANGLKWKCAVVHIRGGGGGGGLRVHTHGASGPRPDGSARVSDLEQVRQYKFLDVLEA